MKNILTLKYNDTLLFFILGVFCFGGAVGRFFLGLSIFDILIILLFIRSIIYHKINSSSLFLFLIIVYGILITILHLFLINKGYSYFITELRFYIYLPLYYQIIKSSNFDKEKINKYFRILLFIYIIIYVFFLNSKGFLLEIFNGVRPENAYDFVGRISGPQVIFLSIVYFITLNINKKINILDTVLYTSLVMIIYIKTGERTVLLTNLLPLIWLIYEKRNIWMLSVIPILASIVPMYVNKTQIKRFNDILNPLDDPAFVYRLKNIKVMMTEDMANYLHSYLTGYGIGSEYDVFVMWHPIHSYFLDNTFVMLIFKLGIPVAFILLAFIYTRSNSLKFSPRIYLIIFITIPALTSYHLILQPAYLMSYFFAIKMLKLK